MPARKKKKVVPLSKIRSDLANYLKSKNIDAYSDKYRSLGERHMNRTKLKLKPGEDQKEYKMGNHFYTIYSRHKTINDAKLQKEAAEWRGIDLVRKKNTLYWEED